ncbi:hypothetical protein INR49_025337, partial [Caranx melampygus]
MRVDSVTGFQTSPPRKSVALVTKTQLVWLDIDFKTDLSSPKFTTQITRLPLDQPSSNSSPTTGKPALEHLDDTLESSATLAPERDCPSPCPTPPPSPPPSPPASPPPLPTLAPHLPLPAVRRAVEDGEGKAEESAHSSQASADSFCRVMGLLGMGHRLFVPRLLATSKEDLLQADFEGALKFFRVQLPKRYRAAENARRLMEQACNIK